MSSQTLLVVDDRDKLLGYAPREKCHTGRGIRHRAFVTLLFDSGGHVILQRRKHRLFDGFWDLTAISHPLHIDGHDESYQEASDRALLRETEIVSVPVRKIGAFNYFAQDGANCENEYCAVLIGRYDGGFRPNSEEVYEVKKINFKNFIAGISKNPQMYTPWARLAAKQLKSRVPLRQVEDEASKAGGQLQSELISFLSIFEPYAKKYFERKIREISKYSPLISKLYRDLADFSSRGKKMRAFLVWLGYRVGKKGQGDRSGKDLERILPIALAFEMTQSFFLIHDDIIDNADLRRGKPTIHKIWGKKLGDEYGRSMAIVLGDIACLEIFNLVNAADFEPAALTSCIKNLTKVLLETAYGQTMDIDNAYRVPTMAEIYKVMDLKSARYSFVGPLTIGAQLAGTNKRQLAAIAGFGLAVGKAFQLQDDILGVFGDKKILGKSVLSDMREGKNTILIYKARQLSSRREQERTDKIWGKGNSGVRELREIRRIIQRSGARQWCTLENKRLATRAKSYIGKITSDLELRQILAEIADFVISRQK